MFDILHNRFRVAVGRNDLVTREAVLEALRKLVNVRGAVVPAWVTELGIRPEPPASSSAAPKPTNWSALVAQFLSSIPATNPTTRSPKAWAAVDTLTGTSASSLVLSGSPSTEAQEQLSIDVVWPLVLAADAIESSLSPGSSETAAHVAWRADLAGVNVLIADIDGGASTGATARQLDERLATARSSLDLPGAKAALARAISIPAEPSLDRALIDAAGAALLFFA